MASIEAGKRQRSFGFSLRPLPFATSCLAFVATIAIAAPGHGTFPFPPDDLPIGVITPIFPPTKTPTPKPTPTLGNILPPQLFPTATPTLSIFLPPKIPTATPTLGIFLPTFKPTSTPPIFLPPTFKPTSTPTLGIFLPTLKPTSTPPIFLPPTFKPTNTPSPTPVLPLCTTDDDCDEGASCIELGDDFPGVAVCVPDATPTPDATETTTPTSTPSATPTWTPQPEAPDGCYGDCNLDGNVSIAELVRLVNMALDDPDAVPCESMDPEEKVSIADLVKAVNSSLDGCF